MTGPASDFGPAEARPVLLRNARLTGVHAPGDADRVAAKLVAALVAPFTVAAVERSVAVAFGIARFPHDGREAERLLHQMLSTGRDLVHQYRRGQIDESRRGLSAIDGIGERFVALMQQLAQAAGPVPFAA